MKKTFYITVCFEDPNLNFSSSSDASTKEEVKKRHIGEIFYFDFKNEGSATCIDVIFS